MHKKRRIIRIIVAVLGMIILVLDSRTAIRGAKSGINLCLNSVIPSLLPFSILTKIICSELNEKSIKILKPLSRILGIPAGTESMFLLSFVAGYPVGAQCIADAYQRKSIRTSDAARMICFCNNAGPAFLFGILSCLFPSILPLWSLYIIHIISAICVGIILPNKTCSTTKLELHSPLSFTKALHNSIIIICTASVWIILFNILIELLKKWLLFAPNILIDVFINGALELSNGCINLLKIDSHSVRYVLCSAFLSFGGLCVTMQTFSVTNQVPKYYYFPGKLLQTSISICLAILSQPLIFKERIIYPAGIIFASFLIISVLTTIFLKKI